MSLYDEAEAIVRIMDDRNFDSEFRKLLEIGKRAKGTSEELAVAAMISVGARHVESCGGDASSYAPPSPGA